MHHIPSDGRPELVKTSRDLLRPTRVRGHKPQLPVDTSALRRDNQFVPITDIRVAIVNMDNPKDRPEQQQLPLNAHRYYILSSLMHLPKHGYAIIQDIEELSDVRTRLGVPTLYENLKRLLDDGLIERADDRPVGAGQVRKTYRLTGLGRAVLIEEEFARKRLAARNWRKVRAEGGI